MARFPIDTPVTTREPIVTVDAGLAIGRHLFRLIVIDAGGRRSTPHDALVDVQRQGPGPIDPVRPPIDPVRPPIDPVRPPIDPVRPPIGPVRSITRRTSASPAPPRRPRTRRKKETS